MNTLFKNNYEKKRRICDRNIHKDMQIPVGIYQTNDEIFVIVQPKNACILEFADHLWLPFIDQHQSDIVVFADKYSLDIQEYSNKMETWNRS